ncbi:hypothetical protein PMZ80_002794 [Knufia obscura]|uniref:Uncharacterized protein n=1 Tax=Knufia obscura TaxID=1635080 RepID=A0ABR0RZB1_9EURO|nr:hypothetical protein PMZ80_002794 [Knufia obscura]
MLGRISPRRNDGNGQKQTVLQGRVQKSYYQRLRPKSHRLLQGAGSINYIDTERLTFFETSMLHILSFAQKLLDVSKKCTSEKCQPQTLQEVQQPAVQPQDIQTTKAFTQYAVQHEEKGNGSVPVDVENKSSSWSPFATRAKAAGPSVSFAFIPRIVSDTIVSATTWKRTPLSASVSEAGHDKAASTSISKPQEEQNVPTKVTTAVTTTSVQLKAPQNTPSGVFQTTKQPTVEAKVICSTSTALQQPTATQDAAVETAQGTQNPFIQSNVTTLATKLPQGQITPQSAPVQAAQASVAVGPQVKVHLSAHTAPAAQGIQPSTAIVQIASTKTCCGVPHCAAAHFHKPSTVKNPFAASQEYPSTSAQVYSLQSIREPHATTVSKKRTYFDYDSDSSYYGEALHPKRLKYSDVQIKETEVIEIDDTHDTYQPQAVVSYKETQLSVSTLPPSFSRHELHTFGVALVHLRHDTWIGDGEYPHEFENRGGILLRGRPPYQSFPLLPPGETYSGCQRPGPDRVVLDGDYSYANIVRHDDDVQGGFRLLG